MDTDDDDIVIVGIGCKFPGAENKDEYWKVLLNGENHVIEVPPERWKIDHFYDSDPDAPGKTYVRRAGFIKSYDEWDNRFYGISDVEAERMDPQQKYILDCVQMALEDGGFTRKQIAASNTGVYIGAMNDDYKMAYSEDLKVTDNYSLTGSSSSLMSARVSFVYNLQGPSMVIDTACSSSLVAMHVAAQAIKSGDCTMAICGGVNCIMYPDMFIPLSKARMVSPKGQCQAFTADADGYARGEGCGIVILKQKKLAISDRNKIWAEISTGCNQDGHVATPITAPSGDQQEKLLQKVYSKNNINVADVQYIEAHGTGTPVGDPIEVNALGNFFRKRKSDNTIFIGSVKTNIGHQESAAGVAGLIKILLMMKHGKIVPSLFFSEGNANRKIDFQKNGFVVPTTVMNWNASSDKKRVACVNSFGFGGTNSHAVIKQTIHNEPKAKRLPHLEKTVVVVSAVDPTSLESSIKDMVKSLENNTFNINEIAYTSTWKRDHYPFRSAYVVSSTKELLDKCNDKLTNGEFSRTDKNQNVVYVFCGVGTTWPGMCQKIISEEPIFADMIAEIDTYLFPMANFKISNILKSGFDSNDAFLNHIAIFSCQVGLAAVWQKWGVTPSAIVGQSVGEVAAAFVAGTLSLEDAVKVIFHRSKVLAKATGGKMIAVGNWPIEEIENICKDYNNKANIAVYSSPKSCTIAGDSDAINAIKIRLQNLSSEKPNTIFIRELPVRCAYHSHHTDKASTEMKDCLHGIKRNIPPHYPIVSSVTAEFGSKQDFVTAEYWESNIRKPVLFSKAITKSYKENMSNIFLEIGPKPVLRSHIDNIFPNAKAKPVCIISMTTQTGTQLLLESLSKLYVAGVNPKWENVVNFQPDITEIPRYQFHRQKILFEPEQRKLKSQGINRDGSTHLFIERSASEEIIFRVLISPQHTPFIYQHFVSNRIVVPGAFYAEIGFEVGKQIFKTSVQSIQISTTFVRPVRLVEKQSKILFGIVTDCSQDKLLLQIKDGQDVIAKCTVKTQTTLGKRSYIDIQKIRQRCHLKQSTENTYKNLENLGFSYGDGIRILGQAFSNEKECLIEIKLSDMIMKGLKDTNIHPAILDGILQTPGVLQEKQEGDERTILPAGIGQLELQRLPIEHMYGYSMVKSESNKDISYNALLLTMDGSIILELKDFVVRYINVENSLDDFDRGKIIWKTISLENNMKTEENIDINRKALIISYNKNDSKTLTTYLENDMVITSLVINHAKEELFRNTITAFCEEHGNNRGKLSILFLPGRHDMGDEPGESVLTRTLVTSNCFLQVTKEVLQMKSLNIPIFVITEATQSQCIDTQNAKINIFGSELWGFTRSVLRETNLRIYLVDVFPCIISNVEVLRRLLLQPPAASELAICNGSLMICEYITFPDASKAVELIPCNRDELSRVELRSCNTENIVDPFLLLKESLPSASDNYRIINIDEACIHSPKLFPVVLQRSFEDSIWPEDFQSGFGVVTLEVKGYISRRKAISSSPAFEKEDMCIACYPVNISNYASVPKECICRLADMPCYQPGLLSTLCILWCISQHLINCEDVYIVVQKQDSVIGKIMLSMLRREKTRKISIVTPESIESSGIDSTHSIILLDKLAPLKWKFLASNFVNISEIVSIRPLLPVDVTRVIKYICPRMKIISLETGDIFDHTNLKNVIPKVKVWMQTEAIQQERESIRHLINASPKQEHDVFPLGIQTMHLAKERTQITASFPLRRPLTQMFLKNGCYIVVGGITGLGWEIVKFLVKNAAGHIITFSRSPPSQSKLREIENINRSSDSKILSLSVDVCNMTSLQNAIAEIKTKCQNLPIKGIFQGAAVLRDVIFFKMTETQLKEVFLPKILGSWNLHLISKQMPLDFFILHSSITSVIGNFGQSNYGAANAFMDTLALYRRSLGLCGQSINWGPLSVGMAADDPNIQKELVKRGYEPLNVDCIHQCLMESIEMGYPQVSFGKFNWKVILQEMSNADVIVKKFKFRTIAETFKESLSIVPNSANSSNHRNEWISIIEDNSEHQKSKCTDFVKKIVSQVFAVDIALISGQTTSLSLGIDSMLAMTLVNKLYEATGTKLPIIDLMSEDLNIIQIAEYLLQFRNESLRSDSEEVDLKLTETMTPYEHGIYKIYQSNPSDPSLITYVDIEVSDSLLGLEGWGKLIKQASLKHLALRTLYIPDHDSGIQYNVRKFVVNPDQFEVDIKSVDIKELTHLERLSSHLSYHTFDPAANTPLRVLFSKGENRNRIRLLFNMLAFDLKSVFLFLMDLNQPDDAINEETLKLNHAKQLSSMDAKLRLDRPRLKSFWLRHLQQPYKPTTLGNIHTTKLDFHTFAFKKLRLPNSLCMKLKENIERKHLTLFQIMVTLYQYMLFRLSGTQTITIVVLGDMRLHFQEFENTVCRFTNPIPLSFTFSDHTRTLETCVFENATRIKSQIAHGELPFAELLDLMKISSPGIVHRHQLTMEDTTPLHSLSAKHDYRFKVMRTVTGNYNNETALYVWHDQHLSYIELELGYNTQIMNVDGADFVLRSLVRLLDVFQRNANIEMNMIDLLSNQEEATPDNKIESEGINELKDSIQSTVTSNIKETDIIRYHDNGAMVKKQTKRGWEHPVYLVVGEKMRSGVTEIFLCWGAAKGKISRHLSLLAIVDFDMKIINNKPSLIIETSQRKYVFNTSTAEVVESWISLLKREIRKKPNK